MFTFTLLSAGTDNVFGKMTDENTGKEVPRMNADTLFHIIHFLFILVFLTQLLSWAYLIVYNVRHLLLYKALIRSRIDPTGPCLLGEKEMMMLYRKLDEECGTRDRKTKHLFVPRKAVGDWIYRNIKTDLTPTQKMILFEVVDGIIDNRINSS